MSYKPKRKKFLDASKIEETVQEISALAADEGVRIALTGGAAMQIYGSDRLTMDVDFIGDDVLPLKDPSPISFGGLRGKAPNGVEVGIIVRQDANLALYEAAMITAQSVEGLPSPVVSPEYLAAMKLEAGRVKDVGDLEFLILSGELDLDAARAVIGKFLGSYAVKDFNSIIYELEWRSSKEKK